MGSVHTTAPWAPWNHGHGRDDAAWGRPGELRISRSIWAAEGHGGVSLSSVVPNPGPGGQLCMLVFLPPN